jgi:hypothetical protein
MYNEIITKASLVVNKFIIYLHVPDKFQDPDLPFTEVIKMRDVENISCRCEIYKL